MSQIPTRATGKSVTIIAVIALLLTPLVLPALCLAWSAKVVAVSDGDTIKVLHDGRQEKIRLYGIDAPEKGQEFGQKAGDFTGSLLAGRNVEVQPKDTDRYGRTVAVVLVDGQILNELIVRNGYAWVYRQYCKEIFCSSWVQAEDAARLQKKGMWNDPAIIPPWQWRHQGRQGTAEVRPPAVATKVETAAGSLHGNVNSRKFHRPGCRVYDCANCTARFQSRAEAISAGYLPCKLCNP